MTAKHAENVLRVPISEIGNNNKSSSENFSSFNKKYTKYIPYIHWPTPCEVAVEMQTMVKCEHLAAESRGWSAFDWAEHCLKQARGIPEDEVCEHYTLRQWQFVGDLERSFQYRKNPSSHDGKVGS